MVAVGPRVELARQQAGISPHEFLAAYLENGGLATPRELGACLVGEIDLEAVEVQKLWDALAWCTERRQLDTLTNNQACM